MVTLMVPNFLVNSLKLGVSFEGVGMESPVVLEICKWKLISEMKAEVFCRGALHGIKIHSEKTLYLVGY